MFTGIVRELGRVESVSASAEGARLELVAPQTAASSALGDSVAVNGCCLTVVACAGGRLAFDAVPETLERTSLGRLVVGGAVNVEPALRAGEPLGGHYVQGHIDGTGTVVDVQQEGLGRRVRIEAAPEILRFVVEKGSLTVEGVSLTVAAIGERDFAVALIPHTLASTTLGALSEGAVVNLEVDVLAKYVERLLPRG